jgi:putative membrane protein
MAKDDPPSEDPDEDQTDDRATRWAEQRTDLAEDRNIMAMERTFAGWIRTAFAAIGIGLAFRAVFGDFDPPWLARAIATLFILSGGWLALSAQHRARKTLAKLDSHKMAETTAPNFRFLAWCVALGSILLTAGLWVLNNGDLGAAN